MNAFGEFINDAARRLRTHHGQCPAILTPRGHSQVVLRAFRSPDSLPLVDTLEPKPARVGVTVRVTLTQGGIVTHGRGRRITTKTHSAEVDAGDTSPNSRLWRVLLVSA